MRVTIPLMIALWAYLLPVGMAAPRTALAPTAFGVRLDSTLEVKSAAPGVYVVTHTYPWPSNSVVVLMNNGEVLLCDTPYTPEATEKLLRWIQLTFGKRRVTAINTHYHIDRLGGNQALVDAAIPIYASDHTLRLLQECGEATRQQMCGWVKDAPIREVLRALKFAKPDRSFPEAEGLTLRFGEDVVQVMHPGAGHTPDNVVVCVPSRGLLYGGCAIVGQEKLGNLAEADPAAWLRAVEKLRKLPASVVVPGHGGDAASYSPELLEHTRRLLKERVKADAAAAKAAR